MQFFADILVPAGINYLQNAESTTSNGQISVAFNGNKLLCPSITCELRTEEFKTHHAKCVLHCC